MNGETIFEGFLNYSLFLGFMILISICISGILLNIFSKLKIRNYWIAVILMIGSFALINHNIPGFVYSTIVYYFFKERLELKTHTRSIFKKEITFILICYGLAFLLNGIFN
jgi:hypothetical protein